MKLKSATWLESYSTFSFNLTKKCKQRIFTHNHSLRVLFFFYVAQVTAFTSTMRCTRMAAKCHSSLVSDDAYDDSAVFWYSHVFAVLTKLFFFVLKRRLILLRSRTRPVKKNGVLRGWSPPIWKHSLVPNLPVIIFSSLPALGLQGWELYSCQYINISLCSQKITNLDFTGSLHRLIWLVNAVYKVPMTRNFLKLTSRIL